MLPPEQPTHKPQSAAYLLVFVENFVGLVGDLGGSVVVVWR